MFTDPFLDFVNLRVHSSSQSKPSGDEFEGIVLEDLYTRGYAFHDTNFKLEKLGIEVDVVATLDDSVEFIEAKGGRPGKGKRPGAKRTDNVKKAICNGALLKSMYDHRYIIYFSSKPKLGSSSDVMIQSALSAGFVDEVRYLEYTI